MKHVMPSSPVVAPLMLAVPATQVSGRRQQPTQPLLPKQPNTTRRTRQTGAEQLTKTETPDGMWKQTNLTSDQNATAVLARGCLNIQRQAHAVRSARCYLHPKDGLSDRPTFLHGAAPQEPQSLTISSWARRRNRARATVGQPRRHEHGDCRYLADFRSMDSLRRGGERPQILQDFFKIFVPSHAPQSHLNAGLSVTRWAVRSGREL